MRAALRVASLSDLWGKEAPGDPEANLQRDLQAHRNPTLADLAAGDVASVEVMGSSRASRLARLSAYGMVPGSELKVIQTRPAILVEVEGTRLALEGDVAAGIQVRRLDT